VTDRVYDRIPLAFEVEYRTAGAFLVAYTANLSKGGLFIETDKPLSIGTELVLRFSIPTSANTEPIEVPGTVAWVRPVPSEGKPAGMGVEFEGLDTRHGEAIDQIVSSFRGLSILIVAGSLSTRSLLVRTVRSILSSADIVDVDKAEDAEAALARSPDLAIVDLDEPEAGEHLYTLRLAKHTASLPVIATSRDEETRLRAAELGADEVLHSPPVVTDLQASILRVLGRPSRIG
jgi:type IV pilus assembly protein PilZ